MNPEQSDYGALYRSLGIAVLVAIAAGVLAFRPTADFPREAPLVDRLPPNLDEWRGE